MASVDIRYFAVADVLVLVRADRRPCHVLAGHDGTSTLLAADGSVAGLRMADFSTSWPRANRVQVAALLGAAVVDEVEARHGALGPAPVCLDLADAELEAALDAGFAVRVDGDDLAA